MSGKIPPDIRSLDFPELECFLLDQGEQRFRARQVWEWLWKKSAGSWDEMTSLPAALRQLLKSHFTLHTAVAAEHRTSADGTLKTALRLHDGLVVERVWIPSGERVTLCISSQAGCALGCAFCATGKMGFARNLLTGEIFDQVTLALPVADPLKPEKNLPDPKSRISNLVFMGMGEPFLNYEAVSRAIEHITDPGGLGLSPQRITVSSVGIPKMIRKMADDRARYHFALSLHAPTDELRNRLIPFNLKHPLTEISEALKYYSSTTGKRFTIEYILFGKVNDSMSEARELARFCRSFPVKINLIEYNPVEGTGFEPSADDRVRAFAAYLEKCNLVVNIRHSRGKDIEAACGQLARKH